MGLFSHTNSIWDFFLIWFALIVIISSISALVFILYWWLLLILSWGLDEKIKIGINTIRYAVIWFISIIIAIYLFPILWNLLGLNVKQYANPQNIFSKIKEIWNIIFLTSYYSNK